MKGRTRADIIDAALSSSHLADSISSYDMPHLLTHADRATQTNDPDVLKRNLRHINKHAKHAIDSAGNLSERILQIPEVRQHMDDINKNRMQSSKGLKQYILTHGG
jgi:hypothetical protein